MKAKNFSFIEELGDELNVKGSIDTHLKTAALFATISVQELMKNGSKEEEAKLLVLEVVKQGMDNKDTLNPI